MPGSLQDRSWVFLGFLRSSSKVWLFLRLIQRLAEFFLPSKNDQSDLEEILEKFLRDLEETPEGPQMDPGGMPEKFRWFTLEFENLAKIFDNFLVKTQGLLWPRRDLGGTFLETSRKDLGGASEGPRKELQRTPRDPGKPRGGAPVDTLETHGNLILKGLKSFTKIKILITML